MRILFTADPELPVPPGQYGGIERLVHLWIQEATARGHHVGLCARQDSTAAVDQLFPWPGSRSQSGGDTVRNTLALFQAARTFRADVIHSSSRLIYTLPALVGHMPVVQTYHRFPGTRQIGIAARLGQRRCAFTGISPFITDLGRPGGGNWHTVYNCIDINRLTFQPTVPAEAPFVFLSRIEEVKGVREAIAIARAAEVPLLIAGNQCADANAERYWRDCVEPELDDQIRYVGPVNDTEKNALLGSARALVVPVQWDEPFGLVFAEALACGTPVISSPRGALPDLIREGETGFLIANQAEGVTAIRRIDQIARSRCREEAIRRFSPAAAFTAFENVYQSVVAPCQK